MNQLERDKQAVRMIFERIPHKALGMQDIALAGGEGLYRAVRELVDAGELMDIDDNGRELYAIGPEFRGRCL